MYSFVKVFLIFAIFSVKLYQIYSTIPNAARSLAIRPIYRINSLPELTRPIAHETRTTIEHSSPGASTSKTRIQNRPTNLRSDVSRRLSDDLNEALLSTSGSRLIPSRDGYYASVNRVLARYGVGVAVGAGAGAGAVELYNRTRTINTLPTTTTPSTTSTTTTTEENNLPLIL